MRVLLFAPSKTHPERPVVIGAPRPPLRSGPCENEQELAPGYSVWNFQARRARATSWWIVTCDSAESGRAVIAFAQAGGTSTYFYSARLGRNVKGRILACSHIP